MNLYWWLPSSRSMMTQKWLFPLVATMGTRRHSLKEPPTETSTGCGRCCCCGQKSLNTVGTVGLEDLINEIDRVQYMNK